MRLHRLWLQCPQWIESGHLGRGGHVARMLPS
jgi:hypothetical protein